MRPIATDDRVARHSVCPSVCLSRGFTWLHYASTAERIQVPFWAVTFGDSRKTLLYGSLVSPTHLICCLHQITLVNYLVVSCMLMCMLLGCIECIRCRLLLAMCSASVCLSVCLSRGSSRLYCANVAEQIKMLFVLNTL